MRDLTRKRLRQGVIISKMVRGNVLHPESPSKNGRNPKQKICSDFGRIDFVQHLMPLARVEMMRDIREACATIAAHEEPKALQLLANGVFAAGKEVNGQCAPNRAKPPGIGQFRSGG